MRCWQWVLVMGAGTNRHRNSILVRCYIAHRPRKSIARKLNIEAQGTRTLSAGAAVVTQYCTGRLVSCILPPVRSACIARGARTARPHARRWVATRRQRPGRPYPRRTHTQHAARGESDEVHPSPESDLARINLPLHHQSGRRHFQCPSAVRQRPSPWRMCRASRHTAQARRAAPA